MSVKPCSSAGTRLPSTARAPYLWLHRNSQYNWSNGTASIIFLGFLIPFLFRKRLVTLDSGPCHVTFHPCFAHEDHGTFPSSRPSIYRPAKHGVLLGSVAGSKCTGENYTGRIWELVSVSKFCPSFYGHPRVTLLRVTLVESCQDFSHPSVTLVENCQDLTTLAAPFEFTATL